MMFSITTNTIEGRPVREYLGIVTGEVIVGANLFRDLFASITDIVGGRAGKYEDVLARARNEAIAVLEGEAARLGGTAVGGVDLAKQENGRASWRASGCRDVQISVVAESLQKQEATPPGRQPGT